MSLAVSDDKVLNHYQVLVVADPATRAELEAIMSPSPVGDLADQAAARLRRLHGECHTAASPPSGDAPVFVQVFILLRHLQQQPFEQAETAPHRCGRSPTARS